MFLLTYLLLLIDEGNSQPKSIIKHSSYISYYKQTENFQDFTTLIFCIKTLKTNETSADCSSLQVDKLITITTAGSSIDLTIPEATVTSQFGDSKYLGRYFIHRSAGEKHRAI